MTRAHWAWSFLFGIALVAEGVKADEWVSGRVVGVHDGDTATVVTRDQHLLKVRFYGVDAPERATEDWPDQPYSDAARQLIAEMLSQREVAVRLTGERTYGREVGEIFVDGRSASRELLRAGLGWWNKKHAPGDSDLAALERAARAARRGLWREPAPEAPWRFRARYRQHGGR